VRCKAAVQRRRKALGVHAEARIQHIERVFTILVK
jgi:hypothetical protein